MVYPDTPGRARFVGIPFDSVLVFQILGWDLAAHREVLCGEGMEEWFDQAHGEQVIPIPLAPFAPHVHKQWTHPHTHRSPSHDTQPGEAQCVVACAVRCQGQWDRGASTHPLHQGHREGGPCPAMSYNVLDCPVALES